MFVIEGEGSLTPSDSTETETNFAVDVPVGCDNSNHS